jgi:outer membrane protein assembly factor BamE (lipoprotein component of BamABCDE complex)
MTLRSAASPIPCRHAAFACLLLAAALLPACKSSSQPAEEPPAQQSALTPGGVKLNLVKGTTTQADVVQAFGTPDLVTHKDDQEIWTYDKTTYDYEKRSDYATLILIGAGGDKVRSTSRSTLLIVYFDKRDIVTDYRLSAIKY